MRSNARFYLYIGVGAIAIVILTAWLVAMFNNGKQETKNKDKTQLQQNANQDEDNNMNQEDGSNQHQDVIRPHVDDDPMMDANNADLDYMPQRPGTEREDAQQEEDVEGKETVVNEGGKDAVDVGANTYTFHAGSILQWPVKGNVIINYSMDKMVYFETLDVYKYHPAICIQAEPGTKVVAGATGEVISITQEPDTGLTIAMRIGSEYVIYYGQLKDCDLKVGDHVNRGEVFAAIEEPTKYYLIEGSHLYLRLERDEEPVNPLSYLDFSE